ncbi:carboxylesterase family protein [Alkaliflexus imshenetskii]|uniref:carboxylesterase family protein n=1 Tax=Alkaliflexus imshenetskii TaxID=286730 RepID=UPI0004B1F0FE|nr:prolyl oligopeptidase family serine peptidase [Alkaliflexus imshenetskii]
MRLLFILLMSCLMSVAIQAQDVAVQDAYLARSFVSKQGDTLLYRILYPENYDRSKKYPLVLFLHGAGERGNDNLKQLTHGASMFLEDEMRKQFPAIVVFPQCAADRYWIDISIRKQLRTGEDIAFNGVFAPPVREQELLDALHRHLIKTESVDKRRLYIMGLSMGAMGTFEMLARHPKRFAAAVPICGGGNVESTSRYARRTALWITHGTLDDVVKVEFSRRMYEALKSAGADVRYTEFPDANHNAWDPTFAMPDLFPWLFSKRR